MTDSARSPTIHLAAWFSARNVVIGLIVIGVFILLLVIPVLSSYGFDAFSSGVHRASKGTFIAGFVILIIGLISGVRIIDYVGGGVMAAVIVGIIIDQYLTARTCPVPPG